MPTPYLKKLSKEGKGSVPSLEKKWDKAGDLAKDAGQDDNYAYRTGILKKMVGAECVPAAMRLLGDTNQRSWAQKFHEGSKVKIIEPFYFDDGQRSKRMMPGVVIQVGNGGSKERGVPGVQKFQYVVRTQFGEHTFDQDDLQAQGQ